jgi:hypothetical protein
MAVDVAPRLIANPIRERTLRPPTAEVAPRRIANPTCWAYRLALLGVALTFLLPSSMLQAFGLYSDAPGGNPLTKFHPATYVFITAAWLALYGRRGAGLTALFRDRPLLAWSIVLIVACMVYSVCMWGISGVAFYIETYLSAALAALALETGTDKQLRGLAYLILALCLLAVCISLIEGRFQQEFLPQAPLELSAAQLKVQQEFGSQVSEFRGPAFYAHPLTGALVTSMALFLVIAMRLRWWFAAFAFAWLVVGLMSFGGRAALGTTLLMIASAALFQFASGLVKREINLGFLAAFVGGSIFIPVLMAVLLTETNVGQRIAEHMYADDSAYARVIQWRVLPLLNLHDILFGVSANRFDVLKAQTGLASGLDMENPWLLTFLGLGLLGWPLLLGSLFSLMLHLGRRANTGASWMLVTAVLLICSTSNSLGRKTPDLVFLSIFAVAMSSFRARQEQAVPEPAPSYISEYFDLIPGRERNLVLVPQPRERSLRENAMD